MWEQLNTWDRDLFVYLNGLGIERYDSFWIFVTQIEHWTPLYLLFFTLFFFAFQRKQALIGSGLTMLTFVITLGTTAVVKNGFSRLRPNNVPELADLIRILQTPSNFSFFSGHAAVSFAVTTFVVLALKPKFKWIYLSYLWPILFVMSRIFVGVHYPGDLLVGAIVGVLIATLVWRFLGDKFLTPYRK